MIKDENNKRFITDFLEQLEVKKNAFYKNPPPVKQYRSRDITFNKGASKIWIDLGCENLSLQEIDRTTKKIKSPISFEKTDEKADTRLKNYHLINIVIPGDAENAEEIREFLLSLKKSEEERENKGLVHFSVGEHHDGFTLHPSLVRRNTKEPLDIDDVTAMYTKVFEKITAKLEALGYQLARNEEKKIER